MPGLTRKPMKRLEAMTEFLHVLQPIELGPVTVPNRIVRSAHATGLTGQGIGEDLIAYHEARARGEVGLTILEAASVHPSTNPGPIGIHGWEDSVVAGYERLMSRLGPYEMRVFQQLWHGGYEQPPFDGSPPWSASALPSVDFGVMSIAMTKGQIDEVVDSYAIAAQHAQRGGLHGVEIQLAHGYLPAHSPITATTSTAGHWKTGCGSRSR
jgi:2,4-dienoyl-CoA reductase-like NADH-dependent reductase (Old Yellow Enzyme family)